MCQECTPGRAMTQWAWTRAVGKRSMRCYRFAAD
jgi:hypothetical protein